MEMLCLFSSTFSQERSLQKPYARFEKLDINKAYLLYCDLSGKGRLWAGTLSILQHTATLWH